MTDNSQNVAQAIERLKQEVPDSQSWTSLFHGGQLMSTTPKKVAGNRVAGAADSPDARRRMTPDDARIPVDDDWRVASILQECGFDVPTFLLAGERAPMLRKEPMEIGILNAGGNAPGLNMVNDSVVKRHFDLARRQGRKAPRIRGYLGGYKGLVEGRWKYLVPSQSLVDPKDRNSYLVTDDFASEGCTRLRTARWDTNDAAAQAIANAIERDGLDVFHPVGGNGTLTGAHGAFQRLTGKVAVVGAPKTMDNDVPFSDPSFGFNTVVDSAMEVISRMALEAETLERVAVVQLFGAGSGFVALNSAYGSGHVDWIVIPEMLPVVGEFEADDRSDHPGTFIPHWPPRATTTEEYTAYVEKMRKALADHIAKRAREKQHAVVVLAEGAVPGLVDPKLAYEATIDLGGAFKHGGDFRKLKETALTQFVEWLKDELTDRGVKNGLMSNYPQHLIRATGPNGFDSVLCKYIGKLMADTAAAGFTDCAVTCWHGRQVIVPLELIAGATRNVHPNSYFPASMMSRMA